ncbi:hypothetical protein F4604DRAFT_1688679 [Suillus subluteus]|nr:hypothetical protein F4604DRAFT_1688679 [Suillus subluteus]
MHKSGPQASEHSEVALQGNPMKFLGRHIIQIVLELVLLFAAEKDAEIEGACITMRGKDSLGNGHFEEFDNTDLSGTISAVWLTLLIIVHFVTGPFTYCPLEREMAAGWTVWHGSSMVGAEGNAPPYEDHDFVQPGVVAVVTAGAGY